MLASLWLEGDVWKPIASLIGGWIGGYTSLLVIKESVDCPDEPFAALLLVASVLAYAWIGILSSGAKHQDRFDRWVRSDQDNSLATASDHTNKPPNESVSLVKIAIWIAVSVIVGQGTLAFAACLPDSPPALSSKTIGFLFLLGIGLAGAMIKSVNDFFKDAMPLATFGLLLVIANSGAKCSLLGLSDATGFLLIGCGVLMLHTVIMIGVAYWSRIPLGVLATASQANIGGVASAPAVAGAYKPGNESMGVLMGMLVANLGLPIGLVAAQLLRLILQ